MKTDGLRAVIYARISKDDGDAEGAGPIDRQLEDCRKHADLYRYEVVETVTDRGKSAYGRVERPGWEQVLSMVESGEVNVIVAWHLDRITRNMGDLERLILLTEKHHVSIATITGDTNLTNETGRMVARILAAVARAEVERKAARQKRANLQRREAGQPWKSGWRSLGYTLQGELVEEEAQHIRSAARDVLQGTGLRGIARRWKEAGLSTPRSAKGADGWTHRGVRSVLLNPKIAGYVTYKGEIVGEGNWEPILDRETFGLLTARLTDPSRSTSSPGRTPTNLLTGIATCAECGEPVHGRTRSVQKQHDGQRRSVGRQPVYACRNEHLSTARLEADQLVLDAFGLAVEVLAPGLVLSIPSGGEAVELVSEAEEKRAELVELGRSHAAGRIPLVVLEAASAAISERLDAIEREIAQTRTTDYDPRELNSSALMKFTELNVDAQRAFLRRLTRIEIHRKGRGRRGVPITEQISLDVKITEDGHTHWVPVLRPGGISELPQRDLGRPSDVLPAMASHLFRARYSSRSFSDLAEIIVREQPPRVTTLADAAAWLVEHEHTDRKPGGVPAKLSPLLRYDRAQGRWILKTPEA